MRGLLLADFWPYKVGLGPCANGQLFCGAAVQPRPSTSRLPVNPVLRPQWLFSRYHEIEHGPVALLAFTVPALFLRLLRHLHPEVGDVQTISAFPATKYCIKLSKFQFRLVNFPSSELLSLLKDIYKHGRRSNPQ